MNNFAIQAGTGCDPSVIKGSGSRGEGMTSATIRHYYESSKGPPFIKFRSCFGFLS